MDKFMHVNPSNLSSTIADKIAAAERLVASKSPASTALNEKVVLVYNKVGLLLSRYKSGKLPKTFKIIPSLPNWFDILLLTDPENWTPHATYEATKLFTSNLKTGDVVKFFSLILLERVRADIYENKYFLSLILVQKPKLPSLYGTKESILQARGLFQRYNRPALHARRMHTPRSSDYRINRIENIHPHASFRRGLVKDRRVAVHRCKLPLYPCGLFIKFLMNSCWIRNTRYRFGSLMHLCFIILRASLIRGGICRCCGIRVCWCFVRGTRRI
jgi:hypothetical protein